jgi:hypothetical protein
VLILRWGGEEQRFADVEAFVGATLKAVAALRTIDAIYDFWEENLASFADLRQRFPGSDHDPVAAIVGTLKGKLRGLGSLGEAKLISDDTGLLLQGPAPEALAIPKEKRLRDKSHLAFVASQPCLICNRRPAQAHHLRFAQGRAMGRKVSDEFTVPLCNGHHDSLHRTGDEPAWWARHGIIDPLKIAARLWAASRQGDNAEQAEAAPPDNEATTSPLNGPAATS